MPVPPAVKATYHILGAVLIAFVFIGVLMTASAQQEVLKQLAAIDPKLDYSSAYVKRLQIDQANADARIAAANEQAANQALAKESDTLDSSTVAFDEAWDSALPQIRQLAALGKCGLEAKALDTGDEGRRAQIVGELMTCEAGATVLGRAPTGLGAATHARSAALVQFNAASQRLARAQANTKALVAQDSKAQQIADCFDTTTKLRGSWYLGGGQLIDFPPALLQIILSFVSGTFGALLITLVLIVYPNTVFEVGGSGGYGARTLLGGLIAVCVYVVLNGGSAVLGSASSVASGNNYMAFCAIGILAGMFSDRIAAWLSDRANSFFSSDKAA